MLTYILTSAPNTLKSAAEIWEKSEHEFPLYFKSSVQCKSKESGRVKTLKIMIIVFQCCCIDIPKLFFFTSTSLTRIISYVLTYVVNRTNVHKTK